MIIDDFFEYGKKMKKIFSMKSNSLWYLHFLKIRKSKV